MCREGQDQVTNKGYETLRSSGGEVQNDSVDKLLFSFYCVCVCLSVLWWRAEG